MGRRRNDIGWHAIYSCKDTNIVLGTCISIIFSAIIRSSFSKATGSRATGIFAHVVMYSIGDLLSLRNYAAKADFQANLM
jgi:hypothetical protein